MKEIGLILGVVPSRVSQIHASAVLKLRARLSASQSTQTRERLTPTWSAAQRTGTRAAEISKS
jgi:hypothetical protein